MKKVELTEDQIILLQTSLDRMISGLVYGSDSYRNLVKQEAAINKAFKKALHPITDADLQDIRRTIGGNK